MCNNRSKTSSYKFSSSFMHKPKWKI